MSPDENEIEQLGREAAAARMASLPPVDEEAALSKIRSELASGGSSRRPFVFGAVAAAVVVIAVVAVVLTRSDDTTTVLTPTTETSAPSTTTTIPPTTPQFAGMPVWPFSGGLGSPSEAAESFAREYLDIVSPSVEANGSSVTVRPRGQGSPTVVQTKETAAGWVVIGATSELIVLDGLRDGDPAPQTVSGQSSAFEATINIEVRPFGSITPVEETFTMGGSTELMPFEAMLQNTSPGVLVVYAADASGEGRVTYATVVRIDRTNGLPSFPGQRLLATKTDGETVELNSAGGHPVDVVPMPSRSDGPLVVSERNGEIRVNEIVIGRGSLPTMPVVRSARIDFVDPNGVSVWQVNLLTGDAEVLFTAQHRITSLDAEVAGALIFTDAENGLWRWDGPENVAGPVKMADGYVNASW